MQMTPFLSVLASILIYVVILAMIIIGAALGLRKTVYAIIFAPFALAVCILFPYDLDQSISEVIVINDEGAIEQEWIFAYKDCYGQRHRVKDGQTYAYVERLADSRELEVYPKAYARDHKLFGKDATCLPESDIITVKEGDFFTLNHHIAYPFSTPDATRETLLTDSIEYSWGLRWHAQDSIQLSSTYGKLVMATIDPVYL